jgi:hypothetical protein
MSTKGGMSTKEMSTKEMRMNNYPCIEMLPTTSKGGNNSKRFKAIFQRDSIWSPGSHGLISITFTPSTCMKGCNDKVCNYYCPIGCPNKCASWSNIGKYSSGQKPSMNLGFLDPPNSSFEFNGQTFPLSLFLYEHRNFDDRSNWIPGGTVIHEFCHALGMLHEHQNNLYNSNPLKLNIPAIINYYTSPQVGLTKQDAETNVINWYSENTPVYGTKNSSSYEGSKYDPESIMLYPLPDEFIIGPNPTQGNFKLSQLDKQWLSREYPLASKNYPQLTVEFIDSDSPAWKIAWVIKTITENLVPFVGVMWTFNTKFWGPLTFYPNSLSATLPPIIPTPIIPTTTLPTTLPIPTTTQP